MITVSQSTFKHVRGVNHLRFGELKPVSPDDSSVIWHSYQAVTGCCQDSAHLLLNREREDFC